MIDINDPKVRWAQHIADKTGMKQVILDNHLGGMDIKRESAVSPIIFNDDILAVIEPKSHRASEHDWLTQSDYLTLHKSEKH